MRRAGFNRPPRRRPSALSRMTTVFPYRQTLGVLPVCLSLVSFGVMGLEIAFARLLAVVLSYHYVFLVLALALLGIGLGGVLGWVLQRGRVPEGSPRALAWQALAFSLSVPVAVFLTIQAGRITAGPGAVVLICLIVCAPFTAAGVFLAGMYRFRPSESHRLYALDLLGAGAGAWGAVLLLDGFGGVGAAMLAGVGGALAALLLSVHKPFAVLPAASLGALLLSLGLGSAGLRPEWLSIPLGRNPDKEINAALHAFQGEVAATRWTAFGRTDLVRYPGRPEGMDLYLDGTAGSPLYQFNGRQEDLARVVETGMASFPGNFPFRFLAPDARGRALVIGPGGGRDVLLALWAGFERVTAVEINPDVVELVRRNSAYSGGIYDGHPRVEVVIDEGRRFIRTRVQPFDLVCLSLPVVNTTRSLEGYALTESFLFTVESVLEYWNRLTPGGSLVVVAHNDAEALRLVVLALTALGREGRGPAEAMRHLVLVGSEDYQCVVLRKAVFTAAETRAMAAAVRGYGFSPRSCFLPFVLVANPRLVDLSLGRIGPDELVREVRGMGWDIAAVTDNRPFFYKLEPGLPAPIVHAFAAAVGIFLLVAIGLLAVRGEPAGQPAAGGLPLAAAIFSLIGIGFMLAETALLSRYYLLFGSPVHAMASFLSGLLGWAGMGSWVGRRWSPADPGRRLQMVCLALFPVLLAYAAALPWCMDQLITLGGGWRQAAAVVLLMPIGLCAGVPFPAAVAWLKGAGFASRIPWMYALNGVASVVGATLSLLLAIGFGYPMVLAAGGACYLAAWLLARTACEPGRDGLKVKDRAAAPA
jgi:hypothetical protein